VISGSKRKPEDEMVNKRATDTSNAQVGLSKAGTMLHIRSGGEAEAVLFYLLCTEYKLRDWFANKKG
jgi:hypothetical protein